LEFQRELAGIPTHALALTYEDVAGKQWGTRARYIANGSRYEDVTISAQG
jgi:hypothetical protein